MVKERQDITGSYCLKDVSGKVIVDEKGIKDSWKEYMEKLMNEENEWDHRISARVKEGPARIKEGPADCIRIDQVAAALKKMKRRKAPVLSGLVAEMIQTTGDIGTHWILDLSNGIVKHTHTQPFYGSVEFVRENPGEPVPEETFTHYSHRSHQSSLSAFSI